MEITQTYVKALFDYRDGFLYWSLSHRIKRLRGKKAGYLKVDKNKPKYKRQVVEFDGKNYYASRLIFLWHKGWLPAVVDHEDRNEENDRIENLRAADGFTNSRNRTSAENSVSKYLGVNKSGEKWMARIGHNNIRIFLGEFEIEEDAAKAYNQAAHRLHKEFANLNIIE